MRHWLIIDANNVASRAFYAIPPMLYQGRQTGAIYGFLQALLRLRESLGGTGFAFCFDHPELLRKKAYPPYKSKPSPDAYSPTHPEKLKKFLTRQLIELKDRVLPEIGFKNVFYREGYEADDLIASISDGLGFKGTIVSSDKDLYQCLGKDVTVYDPGTKIEWTTNAFLDKYQILPRQWAKVKAIAGCTSDNIAGIQGVGERTAIKYVLGALSDNTVAYKNIVAGRDVVARNMNLIELPWPGLELPDLEEDADTPDTWREVLDSLNFRSLRV